MEAEMVQVTGRSEWRIQARAIPTADGPLQCYSHDHRFVEMATNVNKKAYIMLSGHTLYASFSCGCWKILWICKAGHDAALGTPQDLVP